MKIFIRVVVREYTNIFLRIKMAEDTKPSDSVIRRPEDEKCNVCVVLRKLNEEKKKDSRKK